MKKASILLIIFCSLALSSSAQYSMDFGVNLGGANYVGDVGGSQSKSQPWLLDMNLSRTRYSFGGFYRYNFTRNIAAKVSLNYARISGADSLSGIASQRARNLSFRTDIIEAQITAEYYFFTRKNINRASYTRIDFGSYAFAGAGVALFYPYAELDNKWYSLRPLQTEGVDNSYDEMTIVVPLGIGAHLTFNKKLRVGIELGYRFTFTDYLDDISTRYADEADLPFLESVALANRSDEAYFRGDPELPNIGSFQAGKTRGNPEYNDGYFLGQISVSYTIVNRNSFSKARYRKIIYRKRRVRSKF
ncbi:DUF6089 family protein [Vicingaceae bacterium]|nr:DUF6089 family protein [Vicingaceae bacterium]